MQPFVCLGAALAQRGHEVRLLVPRNGAAMGRAAGLETVELPLDVQEMFAAPAAQRMLAAGHIGAFFRWLHREEKAYLEDLRGVLIEATSGVDAIVCHPLVEDRCAAIGEARGVPVIATHFFPILPTRSFPSPFIAQRALGPLNRPTHRLMLHMLWRFSRNEVAAMRQELDLPPARSSYTTAIARGDGHALLAYSPALLPAPPLPRPRRRRDLSLQEARRATAERGPALVLAPGVAAAARALAAQMAREDPVAAAVETVSEQETRAPARTSEE